MLGSRSRQNQLRFLVSLQKLSMLALYHRLIILSQRLRRKSRLHFLLQRLSLMWDLSSLIFALLRLIIILLRLYPFKSLIQLLITVLNILLSVPSWNLLEVLWPFGLHSFSFSRSDDSWQALDGIRISLYFCWLESDVREHFCVHSHRLHKFLSVRRQLLVWKYNSISQQGRSEVLRAEHHQIPPQSLHNIVFTPRHFSPSEIGPRRNMPKVLDIRNLIVQLIILRRQQQQSNPKQIFFRPDFFLFAQEQKFVQINDCDLKRDGPLLEPVSYIEDPFNQHFPEFHTRLSDVLVFAQNHRFEDFLLVFDQIVPMFF